MRLSILLIILFRTFSSFAQYDTSFNYFDLNKKITQPATAVYVSKTIKENGKWHKQVFVLHTAQLYMEGYYSDEKTHLPEGVVKYYGEDENITDSCLFINGQLKSKYAFFASGQLKNYISFTDSIHIDKQGGFTEDGQQIKNYIVWRPAMYPDSIAGWQKYLRKKVNRHQPRGYVSGLMEGTVEIGFVIDTTGSVTNAKIIRKSGFIDLDQRGLTIIEKSPNWIPAILDNHPVISMQKQNISFANNEVNAQANKTINTGFDILHMVGLF